MRCSRPRPRPRSRAHPGAVLLESLISLAIFLAVAAFVLAAARQALDSTRLASLEARGTDLARSALAAIDAGLVPTAALDGGDALLEAIGFLDPEAELAGGDGPETGRWILDVTIDPAAFTGLSLATVTAAWQPAGGDVVATDPADDGDVRVVLRGLVRLSDAGEWSPEEDELLEGLPPDLEAGR